MDDHKKALLEKLTDAGSEDGAQRDMSTRRPGRGGVSAVCALLAAAAAFYGYSHFSTDGKAEEAPRRETTRGPSAQAAERTGPSGASAHEHYVLKTAGYVVARRKATVSSEFLGKIETILVAEGQNVVKGEVLAKLDSREARANVQLQRLTLDAIEAEILETRSQLDTARRVLSRSESFMEKKLISSSAHEQNMATVDELTFRLDAKKAGLGKARWALAIAEKRLEDILIRAPFEGIITMRNAQPGEIVSPVSTGGGYTRTGICTLVDMKSLEVEADVNENYISKVFVDQPVDVSLNSFPEKKYPGKVVAVIPQGNRQSSTITVRIKLGELDPRVFPDMGVAISFRQKTI